MIVRVLRASIAPGRSADFHAFVIDAGLPSVVQRDGLLDVHVGLRTEGSQEIGIIISVWRDWAALESALGPDPNRPYLLLEADGLVTGATVEHFEGLEVPLPSSPSAEFEATELPHPAGTPV
jgi:hypothetical protein